MAVVPAIAWAIEQSDSVDEAADEPPVGPAPAVLVLEAGQEAADAGDDRNGPVGADGDADEDAREGADRGGNDSTRDDLKGAWTVAEQHRQRHLNPLPEGFRQPYS